MEVRFRRKLARNGIGNYNMAIPKQVAAALGEGFVEFIIRNDEIVLAPAK